MIISPRRVPPALYQQSAYVKPTSTVMCTRRHRWRYVSGRREDKAIRHHQSTGICGDKTRENLTPVEITMDGISDVKRAYGPAIGGGGGVVDDSITRRSRHITREAGGHVMAKTPTGRNVHGERLIGICIAVVNTMFVLYAKHFNRDKYRIYGKSCLFNLFQ